MPTAIITGASSGIGRATAILLARSGYDLILLARRKQRLIDLQKILLSENKNVKVLIESLDIQSKKSVDIFVDKHEKLLTQVSVLVNSAGLACGVDKMQNAMVKDWDTMIDTNVKGLLYLTRALLPFFIKNNQGDIVNLGSVAGRWVYPGGGVYCATKFAVRAISEGLRLDLMGTQIRVINIEPGMVETEFSEVRLKDAKKAKMIYQDMTPLSAIDIAETILWCLQRPAHVNIQEMVVFPTDQAGVGYVHRSCKTQVTKNKVNAGKSKR